MMLRGTQTLASLACVLVLLGQEAAALGQKQCLTFSTSTSQGLGGHDHVHEHEHALKLQDDNQVVLGDLSSAALVDNHGHTLVLASKAHRYALPLLLDSADDSAVHLAAANFAADVHKVTGVRPGVYNDTLPRGTRRCVMVGSAGSGLVGGMGLEHVAELEGKWEAWDVRRVKGIRALEEALVVAGSDRRGTVFALYDLSEQLGISPLYYWADVPAPSHPTVTWDGDAVCSHGEPTVKYRGIFINDEIPVLWNWAKERFGIDWPESPFQTEIYEKVFEMVLRMKGNFMWPAMWVSMFSVDGLDPRRNGLPTHPIPGPNQDLAHRMGIVMGTSHHEPMGRNKPEWDLEGSGPWDWRKNEKNLTAWWRYGAERARERETVFTVGLRGDGDEPLVGASVELLEEITDKQRGVIADVYGDEEAKGVPKAWALYKEVQGYYLDGMKVPDDVTALFADDNWGNIMGTLPFDHNHTAGGGIYYHASYVGSPTQYKWINTVNLAKTWEQMQIADAFRTNHIWIINVGDIKHHELPAEHFLSLAYDLDAWPRNSVRRFLTLWAEREFGRGESKEVADIMAKYSQLSARLKPELYNSTSYSVINYEEGERVEETWNDLLARAEKVYHALPKDRRAAFFELVLAPVALVTHANRMYIAVGKNHVHAFQGRTSANRLAERAMRDFQMDHNITERFHSMLGGKWDHMLSQPHLNMNPFYGLHQPRDTLPPVSWVQEHTPAAPRWDGTLPGQPAYVRYTVENSFGAWPGHGFWNCPRRYDCPDPTLYRMDPYGAARRWIDIAAGGPLDTKWTAEVSAPWLSLSRTHGSISKDGNNDQRIYVCVDWDQVPSPSDRGGEIGHVDEATVHIHSSDGSNVTVSTPIVKPVPPPADFKGHVQGDGYVAIEAAHFSQNASQDGYAWEEVEGYGRTLSGMEMYPTTDVNFTLSQGPKLSYDIWLTGIPLTPSSPISQQVEITVQLGPTFNFQLQKQLSFGLSFDGETREIHPIPPVSNAPDAGSIPADWDAVTRTEIRNATATFDLRDAGRPGKHTVDLYGMTSGVIVERIWVDLGGIRERGYSMFGPPESHRM